MTQTVETTNLDGLAQQIIAGRDLTEDEALTLLKTSDAQTLELLNEASILRRKHFGMSVKVNYLVNLKSGLCPEDCNYCSQRLGSAAEILKYKWLKTDEVISQAEMGIGGGAQRVCLVASGRGPTHRDVERVADMITGIKDQHPEVEICACLGILKEGQAQRLREAGADAYNHNINTAASHYESICSTHTYEDRVETVAQAQNAGMSACSGLIVGMGESEEQLVEALFALKAMGSDSVPVNFLMPFDGTPLEGTWELEPLRSLRILAVARMVMPDKEVRMAGGREMHLRSLQGMALHVANSLFLGDYLTSEGQAAQEDLDLIRDNGFHLLGEEASFAPASESSGPSEAASCCGSAAGGCSQESQEELVGAESSAPQASPVLRRRGAGTGQSPNA